MIARQILIGGRVQGVFFRESTRQVARELSLMGSVRNRRDGTVEVLVAGDEKGVDNLINWLKTGPKLAKVSTIEVVDLPPDTLLPQKNNKSQNSNFEIVATD